MTPLTFIDKLHTHSAGLKPTNFPSTVILQGKEVSFGLEFIGPKENMTPTFFQVQEINK